MSLEVNYSSSLIIHCINMAAILNDLMLRRKWFDFQKLQGTLVLSIIVAFIKIPSIRAVKDYHTNRPTGRQIYCRELNEMVISDMRLMFVRDTFAYDEDYENSGRLLSEKPLFKETYTKYARLNNNIGIMLFSVRMGVGTIWYFVGVRASLKAISTEECPSIKGILYQVWYPFNTQKYLPLILINDVMFILDTIIISISCKGTLIAVMLFTISQLKILQQKIEALDEQEQRSEQELLTDIVRRIKEHQEILRVIHFIQKSLSKILFIQYFSSSCELAAFLIFMLTSNSFFNALRSLGAFTMLAYEVFVVFWFANEVQIESIAVVDAIYLKCNWRKYGKKVNNTLLLMLLRSQTPASFKAFFIGNVSLASFTRLMKLCYSVVTFARSFMNTKTTE
ncbi:unnamed protein product [Acanthoscelides obtectus]|uniref:Odorant receptor n=1 Tax=Acanthoscelides obtectus TaxID=200917 RepID=A0A9P0LC98_ACAOB|nr:unnamed protein product [Acanthoscelides obtectus]CAK1638306.1 Odorant receptor Or2 [Acanthoscelides obtectus]